MAEAVDQLVWRLYDVTWDSHGDVVPKIYASKEEAKRDILLYIPPGCIYDIRYEPLFQAQHHDWALGWRQVHMPRAYHCDCDD